MGGVDRTRSTQSMHYEKTDLKNYIKILQLSKSNTISMTKSQNTYIFARSKRGARAHCHNYFISNITKTWVGAIKQNQGN